ncbi:SPFH domain-containing protein [Olsenella sp. DNF00959]|uniref:SPFH domain-containing protein n=1 Tax=Olsenella sp. DNF00959 TaxID=1476999 RepID=UPI000785EF8F|nr:SPFH domain-containing protein [Olsenella sp. DNF00959]KXB63962.1 SPFH/Band 7/PHB domain protein [Olsenella sp. DNF00959]
MSAEKKAHAASGWAMLLVVVVLYLASVYMVVRGIMNVSLYDDLGLVAPVTAWVAIPLGFVMLAVAIILSCGFFTLQPGQARICVLFGKYVGTVRDEGLRWANPFYSRNLGSSNASPSVDIAASLTGISSASAGSPSHVHGAKISTRARTLNGDRLKVNDKMGNPIEIATVVVWRVADTAKAVFDVDDYESFVCMQTETALRHVASIYAYDHMEDEDESASSITLRSNIEEVSESLKAELERKLAVAGVAVDDARLTHLAYAPEIAQAMLRRQQADAVIAARKKIVEGAVSMVDMALAQLSDGGIVEFDDDRKAVMASNLMVVLCGESEAQPVLNTGSLYQ